MGHHSSHSSHSVPQQIDRFADAAQPGDSDGGVTDGSYGPIFERDRERGALEVHSQRGVDPGLNTDRGLWTASQLLVMSTSPRVL